MADTDLDLDLSMPQQQQPQQQQEQEQSHHNHHPSQAPPPEDDHEQDLSFVSVSQESLVDVSFPFSEDRLDKTLAVPVDDPTIDVTTKELLYDQDQDDNDDTLEDATAGGGGAGGQDYHIVQRYHDDQDEGDDAHDVQEETFEYEVPQAIGTPPLSQSADPQQLIHQEVHLQEEDTDREQDNSNTQEEEQHQSSDALPLSIRSLPASAATPPPLHPNHHFSSSSNIRHSQMGAGPSSTSSFDATPMQPSPSDNHSNNNYNHRIRHVSSSNRLSRAPKHEPSLPFPEPAVLPALPPLIPVSRITSPTSPSGSMSTSATPATPVSASLAGRMKGHSLTSIAVHDSRTALATESRMVPSSWPADPNSTETGKVPTREPNTEPTASSGPTPSSGQEPTTPSTVITPPEDDNIKNTQDNGNCKNTNTEAEANAGETDDSSSWPEHPRQFLERVKETVSKAELGTLLSKGSDSFHQAVLRIHMESFDFRRDPIDLALRKFLLDFHFPKEAQQIDRVLEAFAGHCKLCQIRDEI
ncbi:hypothetical protein BGZ89_007545 [Linnemannia elongata]|nr:hypothetical protein BGZ89_007545 [Linnemannia elongata]